MSHFLVYITVLRHKIKSSRPVPPCHHLSVFNPVFACMRKARTQLSAKDSSDPNCHLAGLPPEIWMKILELLPLNELWKTARPVCAFWNAVANEFARSVFYKDSKCEISTLFDKEDGFKHYERDYLLPLEPRDKIRSLPNTATKAQVHQLLVWRRLGASTHEWTSFKSPDNIWPRVIQYSISFGVRNNRISDGL